MTKRTKVITVTVVVIILLANYSPLNYFLRQNYTYSNIDGSFTFSEEYGKGFDHLSVFRRYAVFLARNPDKDFGDNRLFRTFTLQPWAFWQWHEMIFHSDRFRLPYKEPGR